MDKIKLPYNKMDMDPNVDWDVLVKMLQGTCNEQEKLHFEQWLAQNAENRKFFEELKLSWETSGNIFDDYIPDHKKSWKKILEKIKPETKSKSIVWYLSGAAAVVLIFLGIAYWLFLPENSKFIVVENKNENALKYTLPDSSVVWIAKKSNIHYKMDFKEKRSLNLNGTAYFEVTHDAKNAFSVSCKGTQVKVLGTSFLINNSNDTTEVLLEVYTGKVLFCYEGINDTLIKGQASTAKLTNKAMAHQEVVVNSLAWKTGRIIFENAKLSEVARFLSNYYNIEIRIEDQQIASKSFTSSLDNLKIDESLIIISETLQIHFKKTEEGYLLY